MKTTDKDLKRVCPTYAVGRTKKVRGSINDCVDERKKEEAGEGRVDLILNADPTTNEACVQFPSLS